MADEYRIPEVVIEAIDRLLRETSLTPHEIARTLSTEEAPVHYVSVSSRAAILQFSGVERPKASGLAGDAAANSALEFLIKRGYAKEAIEKLSALEGKPVHNVDANKEIARRRGPQPGTGGRPPKAGSRRITRGVNLTPDTWAIIESARLPGESLGDVVERLVRESRRN